MADLSPDRLKTLLDRMGGRQIVVIGDVMLDRYLIGDTERISPEAPVPVVTVKESRHAPGGAANVAANVAALGAVCRLVGVTGTDRDGEMLRQALTTGGVPDRWLLGVGQRPTTSKTRVVARGQQVVRIDEEEDAPLDTATLRRLGDLATEALADTYSGATIFKPNRRELGAAIPGIDLASAKDLIGAADTVTAWAGAVLAAGGTAIEAAQVANLAASVEVGKAGVATVTPDEVMALHG